VRKEDQLTLKKKNRVAAVAAAIKRQDSMVGQMTTLHRQALGSSAASSRRSSPGRVGGDEDTGSSFGWICISIINYTSFFENVL
jgi:hypothetical protein